MLLKSHDQDDEQDGEQVVDQTDDKISSPIIKTVPLGIGDSRYLDYPRTRKERRTWKRMVHYIALRDPGHHSHYPAGTVV